MLRLSLATTAAASLPAQTNQLATAWSSALLRKGIRLRHLLAVHASAALPPEEPIGDGRSPQLLRPHSRQMHRHSFAARMNQIATLALSGSRAKNQIVTLPRSGPRHLAARSRPVSLTCLATGGLRA